jgi:hypothetical protein
MQQPPDPRPALRASDADRERVVTLLQEACGDGRLTIDEFGERSAAAYTARTVDALAALTRDLVPGAANGPAATLARGRGPMTVSGAAETAPPAVAVFSGARRAGRWRPARRETAVAVFGGVELDLRDAELPREGVRLSAWALFGGIDVTVPEGTRVELSGFAVFGGRNVEGGDRPTDPTGFVLRVQAVAVFGGVNVKVRGRRPTRP